MRVTMIGSAHVGLVSGACFADLGHDVVCVDKDPGKIEGLMNRTLMVDLRNVDRSREARGEGFDYVGIGKP